MNRYSTRVVDWQRRQDSVDQMPPDHERTYTPYDLDHYRHLATAQAPGPSLIEQDRQRIAAARAFVMALVVALIGFGFLLWLLVEGLRDVL